MPTPASGTIGLLNVNQEIGNGTNAISLDWVRNNTKDSASALASIYNRAWYQRNVDGNCNNGNCTTNCDCVARCVIVQNCYNCSACTAVNCANCDARAWLQTNCNCACTYNCNITGSFNTNCNCNCNCDCGGRC